MASNMSRCKMKYCIKQQPSIVTQRNQIQIHISEKSFLDLLSIEIETIISAQNRFIITICFHSINYLSFLKVLCILLSAYCYVVSNKQFIAKFLCPKQVLSIHVALCYVINVYVQGRAGVNVAFIFYFICFYSIRYSGDSTLISLQNT